MNTLTLKSLRYHARHGFYEKERREGNDFEVDLVFHADLRQAGESDALAHTVDYQEAEEMVRSVMEGPSVKLIETLAVRIGESLFEAFAHVQQIEVAVRKLQPPLPTETAYSEVRMTWQRQ